MSIELLGATNDTIALSGLDFWTNAGRELTLAVTITPSSIVDQENLVGKWGASLIFRSFVLLAYETTRLAFVVSNGASVFTRRTTGSVIGTGALYRIVAKWRGNTVGGPGMQMWVNGSEVTLEDWFGSTSFESFNVAVGYDVMIGHRATDTFDGVDGYYSDVLIAEDWLPDDFCKALSNGWSPHFTRSMVPYGSYLQLIRAIQDHWGNATVTSTTTAVQAHPSVIYPASSPAMYRVAATSTSTARPKIDGHLGTARLVGGALVG